MLGRNKVKKVCYTYLNVPLSNFCRQFSMTGLVKMKILYTSFHLAQKYCKCRIRILKMDAVISISDTSG